MGDFCDVTFVIDNWSGWGTCRNAHKAIEKLDNYDRIENEHTRFYLYLDQKI